MPGLILFFLNIFTETTEFSGIRIRILGLEEEHADPHLRCIFSLG